MTTNTALILIDIQNDYFPGGRCALFQPEQAAENAQRALEAFRSKNAPVYHIRHISLQEGADLFLPGSAGAEIYERVAPIAGESVLTKQYPNAFLQTSLKEDLHASGINRFAICGMMSHMCIDTTVRAARELGFSISLLHDACTTKDLTWGGNAIPAQAVHAAMMAALNGVFAQVLSVSEYLQNE